MAMNSFRIFMKDNLGSVRAVYNEVGDRLWFVTKDVCACLGIKNSRQATKDFMPDEKADVILNDTRSDGKVQRRQFSVVSESGLYLLIMKSRKPEAISFQRFVTKELLPSFRRHTLTQYTIEGETYCTPPRDEEWEKFLKRTADDMKAMHNLPKTIKEEDGFLPSFTDSLWPEGEAWETLP